MAPKQHLENDGNSPKAVPVVSPENARFSELVENGKFGKILKDPTTGDVAVIFGENQVAKLISRETFTSKPEYGSEKDSVDKAAFVSPRGATFRPRIESRPMTNAEILEAAKAKIEAARKGEPLSVTVPKMLSEFGVALEESGDSFRLSNSEGNASLDFKIEGKNAVERRKKAAQLHLMVGKAIETMQTCEAKNPLLQQCSAYADTDMIASYGYRELKIDDSMFGDTVIASGEELAGLTSRERRNFAEKLAPFINSVFKARYDAVVRNGGGKMVSK